MAEHWNGEVDVNEVLEPVRDDRGKWAKGATSPNPGGYSKADRLAHQNVREAAKLRNAGMRLANAEADALLR